MSARALKFECSEKKTIALHAIQFYKVGVVLDASAVSALFSMDALLLSAFRKIAEWEIRKWGAAVTAAHPPRTTDLWYNIVTA